MLVRRGGKLIEIMLPILLVKVIAVVNFVPVVYHAGVKLHSIISTLLSTSTSSESHFEFLSSDPLVIVIHSLLSGIV